MAQTGNHKGLQFGIFLAPFHRVGENPTLGHGARHGADRMDRRAGLRRGLDRRASFGRLGDHRLAGGLHRRRHRAHALHPARLGRDQPALSPSADGGEPLRAARPHVARPHHAGLRPGRAAVGRLHDGHRPLDPARPHGGVARRHHAAAEVRGAGHHEDRLVRAEGGAAASRALFLSAFPDRLRQHHHAVGHDRGRQARARRAVDRRRPAGRPGGDGQAMGDLRGDRGQARPHGRPLEVAHRGQRAPRRGRRAGAARGPCRRAAARP